LVNKKIRTFFAICGGRFFVCAIIYDVTNEGETPYCCVPYVSLSLRGNEMKHFWFYHVDTYVDFSEHTIQMYH